MSINKFSRICRGCLATERRMMKAKSYEDMFKDLTGIIISPTDGLPQWLCYECLALLDKYNKFRNKLLQSHYMLCQFVLENIPFSKDKSANTLLSQTGVVCEEFPAVTTEQKEEQINRPDDTDTPVITKIESVAVKEEPIFRDYEYNVPIEGNCEEIFQSPDHKTFAQVGPGTTLTPNSTLYQSATTSSHEKNTLCVSPLNVKTEGGEALITTGHATARIYPTNTTSKRHRDDTKKKAKISIHRDDSVNSSSRSNVQSYTCDTCNKCFSDKVLLITHIHNIHASYQCDVCMEHFIGYNALMKHIHIHSAERPYKCDVCNKCFRQQNNLKSHRRIHTGEKPYKCDVCKKSFTERSTLTRHVRIHSGEKPFKCDVCMKCYTQKADMIYHRKTHSAEKPYKCDICMKGFRKKSYHKAHMRLHTGDKPYKCDICMKSFNRKNDLKLHIRKHTGDQPSFKCDVCMKSFTQKSCLTRHSRIHTGDRPYKCDTCMKSFSVKSTLDAHIRIHTGDKPYKCDVCMKCFNQRSSLYVHKKIHSANR